MIDISPEVTLFMLFGLLVVLLATGYPLAFALAGAGAAVGFLGWGPRIFELFYFRALGALESYSLLAIPLFVFMGLMVEKSGLASRMFDSFLLLLGRLRGVLAMVTILTGTVLAACVGVFSASVTTLGLLAVPAMMRRRYNMHLGTGSICAGGCLGIMIPPSIMLILYGPLAGVSVGKLFMAAFPTGLLLSGLYITYVLIICFMNPKVGPALPPEERTASLRTKLVSVSVSVIPPAVLIFGVLGSIFLGVATPTEAAGAGAAISILLALGYRSFDIRILKEVALGTLSVSSMIIVIVIGANMFTGTFMALGCGDILEDLILAAPFGRWGTLIAIILVVIFLGMFIDWIGILLILVPVVSPLVTVLGFDPIWFAMMLALALQIGYMSPPFAPAIFFLQGVIPPETGITTATIIRGVMPFIGLILVAIILLIIFPEIALWLPSMMIK